MTQSYLERGESQDAARRCGTGQPRASRDVQQAQALEESPRAKGLVQPLWLRCPGQQGGPAPADRRIYGHEVARNVLGSGSVAPEIPWSASVPEGLEVR